MHGKLGRQMSLTKQKPVIHRFCKHVNYFKFYLQHSNRSNQTLRKVKFKSKKVKVHVFKHSKLGHTFVVRSKSISTWNNARKEIMARNFDENIFFQDQPKIKVRCQLRCIFLLSSTLILTKTQTFTPSFSIPFQRFLRLLLSLA